jgi:lipopolysaccharide transport system permease protein
MGIMRVQNDFNKQYLSYLNFCQLVVTKIRFNLRSEVAESYLSYAWWVLEPVLHMGVFYLVFEVIMDRGGPNFVVFLLCGLVPWLWCAKSVNNSSRSMMQGKGLISQTNIPKFFFPLVVVGQDTFKQTFAFALLIFILLASGYPITVYWFWLIPIVAVQILFIISISFFVSFVIPFAADLLYLVRSGLTLWMLLSGIFYDYEKVLLPEHRELFLLNPMANLIASYRRVLLYGENPEIMNLLLVGLLSVLLIGLMSLIMKRYSNRLTRLVID